MEVACVISTVHGFKLPAHFSAVKCRCAAESSEKKYVVLFLQKGKQAMKELPEDYEYYPELKGFFTTASALIDFCRSPSGSLNQFSTLLNDYRKEAREYMNDLDFIFE